MSTGSLTGGIIGGVVGAILFGPTGGYYGFMLGFSLGTFLDPTTSDVSTPGTPSPDNFEVTSNDIGIIIPDLAGTAEIKGHLLWYGNERQVYSESEGYSYYMSWALGICVGSVDTLYNISTDEENIWSGVLNCPESGGERTITLGQSDTVYDYSLHLAPKASTKSLTDSPADFPADSPMNPYGGLVPPGGFDVGLGDLTFYYGTADQVANTKMGALLSDETLNTPYRYCCWAYIDDYYVGNYPRMPSLSFTIGKKPVYTFSTYNEIQIYDCNPAHVLWYILHDLTGLSESWLNTAAFTAFAEELYDENRGLSFLFDRTQSALDYIESLNAHISGFLRYGSDAKFHPKLIREDYDVDTLPTVDESDLLEEPEMERKSWIDTVNEVKVQYSEIYLQD